MSTRVQATLVDLQKRIAELENQVELWKAHAEEERRRGSES